MQKKRQLTLGLMKTSVLILSLLAIAVICAPHMNGTIPGAGTGEIEASDPATSILYDKMFYEFSGAFGIYGLYTMGMSGYVRYSHESGNLFAADYSDTFMGAAPYTVNNITRARNDGMHDIFWIFNNATINTTILLRNPFAGDQNFTVVGESNQTAAGIVYPCWHLTGPTSSVAYFHKASGLLIYAEFRFGISGYTEFMRYQLSRSNAPNTSPPTLSAGQVVPTSGSTTTVFRYTVNYTDPDNHDPEAVNVVIDGVPHAMAKENASDTNYTDGAIYYYQTPLTNTTHSFFFNASDWRFTTNTTVFDGPNPVSKLTDTPPTLAFVNLYPTIGHLNVNFRFRVNYTDADNDVPAWVNVTINGTVVSMTKLDPGDNNYIDGVVYQCYHKFTLPGNYSFHFNASDGINQVGTPATPILGPTVWAPYEAPSPLFNGAYMNYSGSYDSYYTFNGRVNNTHMGGNIFQAAHSNTRGSSTLTVDNRTRYFTATNNFWGTSGYDWTWIFTNVSLTDTIPVAIYQSSYRNFTVTGEATRNRLGKTFNCWVLQDTMGSILYYDKVVGLFIEGSFVTGSGIPYTMYITDTNIPDASPPTLTGGAVTPTIGDMTTSFVFNVTYTDPDNNHPTYVRVIINNVTYSMTKQNAGDNNYMDGCVYRYVTTLQNISYSFRFVASDGHFSARDPAVGTIAGPEVWKSNLNPAVLGSAYLAPKYVTEWDTYYFRVTYTDPDNIAPDYVRLVVFKDGNPFGTYTMTKETPSDVNYMDGVNYTVSQQFGIGNYTYYFTTNDTKFVTNTTTFTDLIITPAKMSVFDGLYFNYAISTNIGASGSGSVLFTMVNATAYNCSEVRTVVVYGNPITTRYWSIFDIRSRRILSSSSSSEVGRQTVNMIWNNTRVGTITNMASENIPYGYYPCIGLESISVMSRNFDCWKFQTGGNRIYFEQRTGMFMYSYSDIGMGYYETKTVTATNMIFANDKPVVMGGAINNTSIPMNRTGDAITWVITDPNGDSGTYRVLVNGTLYIDWTAWTPGTAFQVPVDTNRGLGTFNYTLQYRDTPGAYGDESHVYVTIYEVPTSNHPENQVLLANSTGATIDWLLRDRVGSGMYRVLRNGATLIAWTTWTNDTTLNIPVNANIGLGDWNYTIQFNHSRGDFGIPDTVIITVNDRPAASLAVPVNGTTYSKNQTGYDIPWVVNDLVGGTGTYNVSINGTLYVWGAWASGTRVNVTIDTNRGLGWFNYTFCYTDVHGARGSDSHVLVRVANLPFANHPVDVVYLQNAASTPITWVLTDETGAGQYRVLRNGIVLVPWTPWTNGSGIDVPVATSLNWGYWNYTIQFNNSAGQAGIQDTVIVTIDDLPFAVQEPVAIEVDQNSTRLITWVLRDRIGAGTFTLYVNGVAHPMYTNVAWVNNSAIYISVETNWGLGTFNYTLKFVDANGFEGPASTVFITIKQTTIIIPENPFILFLGTYWLILVPAVGGLIALLAVMGARARRKKKVAGAKKTGKREIPMPKKGTQYTRPGDHLASSLASKTTTVQYSAPSSQPPSAGLQHPGDIAAPAPQTAKFYCAACKSFFNIPTPDFVTWYTCPACTSLLVHVVDCPACGEAIALSKDNYASYKAGGLTCPRCNGSVNI
ncbi:MAG: hypothetical protein Q6373_010760 [Candidatus Sigynarchaeota archaeon]